MILVLPVKWNKTLKYELSEISTLASKGSIKVRKVKGVGHCATYLLKYVCVCV